MLYIIEVVQPGQGLPINLSGQDLIDRYKELALKDAADRGITEISEKEMYAKAWELAKNDGHDLTEYTTKRDEKFTFNRAQLDGKLDRQSAAQEVGNAGKWNRDRQPADSGRLAGNSVQNVINRYRVSSRSSDVDYERATNNGLDMSKIVALRDKHGEDYKISSKDDIYTPRPETKTKSKTEQKKSTAADVAEATREICGALVEECFAGTNREWSKGVQNAKKMNLGISFSDLVKARNGETAIPHQKLREAMHSLNEFKANQKTTERKSVRRTEQKRDTAAEVAKATREICGALVKECFAGTTDWDVGVANAKKMKLGITFSDLVKARNGEIAIPHHKLRAALRNQYEFKKNQSLERQRSGKNPAQDSKQAVEKTYHLPKGDYRFDMSVEGRNRTFTLYDAKNRRLAQVDLNSRGKIKEYRLPTKSGWAEVNPRKVEKNPKVHPILKAALKEMPEIVKTIR